MATSFLLPTLDSTGTVSGMKSVSIDLTQKVTQPTTNSCAAVLSGANSTNADAFLGRYNITAFQTALSNAASILSDAKISSDEDTSSVSNSIALTRYISSLTNTSIPTLQFMKNCIEEAKGTPDLKSYQDAKVKLDASKERLELLNNPENHVSYYEGWFPMTRPFRESSLFILFGSGLLLLLVAIVLFMKKQGVDINIQTSPEYEAAVNSIFSIVKSYTFLIVAAGFLIGYLVHIYRKK
jgi:hypothetical protein